jgi:glycosyltransferase involved in cell wall biosynthesis
MIKILYETSTFGLAYSDPRNRTGIFRYIESMLDNIAKNPEIDFKLTAYTHCYNSKFLEFFLANEKTEWLDKFLDPYQKQLTSDQLYLNVLNNINQNGSRDIFNKAKRKSQAIFLGFLASLAIPSNINEPFDIYHSFYHPFLPKSRINAKARVITIYDMIPLLMPHYFKNGFDKVFLNILKNINPNQDWVIAISESTKRDFCSISKMPEERVFVTPLASSYKFYQESDSIKIDTITKKYKIPSGKYILGLSTLEPRKNTVTLIKCFYKLIVENAIKDTYLVLVGSKGWLFDEIFKTAKTQPDLLDRIIFTDYIQDSDLSAIYSGATCFVYPSFYEGFGLPPLEAMQCGVPVITSNTSSLPEVVGDAAILIDPTDQDQLCQAMLTLLGDEKLREILKQKGLKRAQQFSWKKCADQTTEIYKKVINSK